MSILKSGILHSAFSSGTSLAIPDPRSNRGQALIGDPEKTCPDPRFREDEKLNNRLVGRFLVTLLFLIIVFLLRADTTFAASSVTAEGITVSPAIVNLDLPTGQASSSFKVNITNNTNRPVTFTVSSVDFKSLNDTGGIAFIGNSSAQVAGKHSLAPWINAIQAPLTVAPKQTITVPIVIENRSDLGPGGHYAAVLYTVADVSSAAGATRVSVNEVASTLVFVRKIDGAQFAISLDKPRVAFSWWHIPSNINLFFKNTGNIQTVPRGLVTISSPLSKEVRRGQINTDSSLVLPDSTRLYRTSLFSTGSTWLPGVYKVHVFYHPDGSSELQYFDSTFMFVNLMTIGEASLAIILLLIAYDVTMHRHGLMKKILTQKQGRYHLRK